MPPAYQHLPLPVAALCRRSRNAKSPKEQHDLAYYAFEVSLRLGVARSRPEDLRGLLRGQLGEWARAFRPASERSEAPAVLRTFAALVEISQQRSSERRVVSAREWVDAWVAYRNKVIGHGANRTASFYAEHAEILRDGVDAAWQVGLFWPSGCHLRFVDTVDVLPDGQRLARVLALEGGSPSLLHERLPVPGHVFYRRVHAELDGEWTSLWPLVVFDEENESVPCFSAMRRHAEFLDYSSGLTLTPDALARVDPGLDRELRGIAELGSSSGSSGSRPQPATGSPDVAPPSSSIRLVCELGRGANGTVHLGWQEELERAVAIKRLTAAGTSDPVARARFAREARALAALDHPNIVRVLGTAQGTEGPELVLEFIPGVDLRALSEMPPGVGLPSEALRAAIERRMLQIRESLPQLAWHVGHGQYGTRRDREQEIVELFRGAARGLAHAHERGIVHRDLSPGNVMAVLPGPRAVLTDFGLAAFKDQESKLTHNEGAPLGTLRYVAPERLNPAAGEFEPASDVYSLGALLYESLTCRPMFDATTAPALMRAIQFDDPAWLRSVRPELSRDVEAVVHRAIAKHPSQRYPTAEDLARDLERLLAGEPVLAPVVGRAHRAKRWLRRHKLAVAGVLIALIAAGAGLVVGRQQPRHPIVDLGSLDKQLAALSIDELRRVEEEIQRQIERAAAQPPRARHASELDEGRSGTLRMALAELSEAERDELEAMFPDFRNGRPAKHAWTAENDAALRAVIGRARDSGQFNRAVVLAVRECALASMELGILDPAALALDFVIDGLDALEGGNAALTLEAIALRGWVHHQLGELGPARELYAEALAGYESSFLGQPELWRLIPARIAAIDAAEGQSELANEGFASWIERWSGEDARSRDDQRVVETLIVSIPDKDLVDRLLARMRMCWRHFDAPAPSSTDVKLDVHTEVVATDVEADVLTEVVGGDGPAEPAGPSLAREVGSMAEARRLLQASSSLASSDPVAARQALERAYLILADYLPADSALLGEIAAILGSESRVRSGH